MIETLRAVAHPWLCDINGHLNTRHYQSWFDDATMHLLGACGFDAVNARLIGVGVVDVKCVMEYQAEVPPGGLTVLRSGFRKLGRSSFVSFHEMLSARSAQLHATCETTSLFFDLEARRSMAMPDDFRQAVEALLEPES
ncbi:MAG: acyl-CoA thioesterase [Phenylobacterium sp.]